MGFKFGVSVSEDEQDEEEDDSVDKIKLKQQFHYFLDQLDYNSINREVIC
jgi:hypothetical protein